LLDIGEARQQGHGLATSSGVGGVFLRSILQHGHGNLHPHLANRNKDSRSIGFRSSLEELLQLRRQFFRVADHDGFHLRFGGVVFILGIRWSCSARGGVGRRAAKIDRPVP
jgi:hypothetical protein